MNQEIRRLMEQRNGLREEISRLIAELEELENEMKMKMVENLTVDQLLSLLENSSTPTEETEVEETEVEETEIEETEIEETEVEEVPAQETEQNEEEVILTANNIHQAVNDEITEIINQHVENITNDEAEDPIEIEIETEESETTETEEINNCPHISSDQVTYDMLTDEMHEAKITLVGVQYQDLYRDGEVPTIGQRVTLTKETETSNTYGRIADGRTIGLFPQSNEKIEQLERIGAKYEKNENMHPNHALLQNEYEVVGFIPGCFIFLDPIQEETEVENEITPETNEVNEGVEQLNGEASTINEARTIFNNCKNNCTIDEITEYEFFFTISYLNHNANTMEEYHKECCVAKA